MKYIKFFEELDNMTYLSAADKLKDKHPLRSINLINWVKEKQNLTHDRIYPHKFNIDNIQFSVKDVVLNTVEYDGDKIYVYAVIFFSKTENYVLVLGIREKIERSSISGLLVRKYDINKFRIYRHWKSDLAGNFQENFAFEDRRDAYEFKKLLLEESDEEYISVIKNVKINDLYVSKVSEELDSNTYLSAADKLRKHHPKRSKELEEWSSKVSDNLIDRIYHHKFKINCDEMNGEFSITNASSEKSWSLLHRHMHISSGQNEGVIFHIDMSSKIYNIELEIRVFNFNSEYSSVTDLSCVNVEVWKKTDKSGNDTRMNSEDFKFDNRKDAYEMRRFLIEDFPEHRELLLKTSVNDFYESK